MIDIAIIGGGPAGLAAGLYAARGGASTVLFEEVFVGGQAAKTPRIDNYPGFIDGIEGSELGIRMHDQAVRFGLDIRYEPVDGLDLAYPTKSVQTANGCVLSRTVILSMGASPKKLNLKNEDSFVGAGLSYCASCDGAFFRNKEVCVIGGGDTALQDALYLARFAKKVYLIHRRNEFRGCKLLQSSVLAENNIEVLWSHVATELLGEGAIEGIRLRHIESNTIKELVLSGVFIAVGIEPRTDLVRGQLQLSTGGYIKTDEAMRTALAGVYAAGDARETPLRQVVTAVSDGAVAATSALEYLSTLKQAASN